MLIAVSLLGLVCLSKKPNPDGVWPDDFTSSGRLSAGSQIAAAIWPSLILVRRKKKKPTTPDVGRRLSIAFYIYPCSLMISKMCRKNRLYCMSRLVSDLLMTEVLLT